MTSPLNPGLRVRWLLATLAIVVMISCNLEDTSYSDINTFETPDRPGQLAQLLGTAYNGLTSIGSHGGYFSLQSVASDEIAIPQRGDAWSDGQWVRIHRHEQNGFENAVNGAWTELYRNVDDCNALIALLNGLVADGSIDEGAARTFISEIRVLRAYYYYWLLDLFGNIPIVTQFDDPDLLPATVPRAEVFDFIVNELETCVPDLSRQQDVTTYGRFNFWAGKALLSRLYLNSVVYSGNEMWDAAIAAADEIINSGLFALSSDYFANFRVDNTGSVENILVVLYDNQSNCCFQWAHMTLHPASRSTFALTDQPWNGYCSLQEFYEAYDDADLRKGVSGSQSIRGNFLAGPQFAPDGSTPVVDENAEANDPDGPHLHYTPEINELWPNALNQAGVRIWKYAYGGGASTMSNDFVLFRYSEVLLNKAESLWRRGDQSGRLLVNLIRARAEVPDFDVLDADNLLAERGRELFMEGLRRSDLIRFGVYEEEWEFKPPSDPTRRLMPIPQTQLNANPNLVQNPGY